MAADHEDVIMEVLKLRSEDVMAIDSALDPEREREAKSQFSEQELQLMELQQSEHRSWLHRFDGGEELRNDDRGFSFNRHRESCWNDMPGAVLAKKARAAQAKKRLRRYWQ